MGTAQGVAEVEATREYKIEAMLQKELHIIDQAAGVAELLAVSTLS